MAKASMSKTSVSRDLEDYVEDFVKKHPNAKVKKRFDDLKCSIEKVQFHTLNLICITVFTIVFGQSGLCEQTV